MSRHVANLPNLVIASGGTNSTSTPSGALDDALSVMIVAPAALTTQLKVQVSLDNGTLWGDLQSANTNIFVSQAQAVAVVGIPGDALLRVVDVAGTEATTRILTITKAFGVDS